MASLYTIQGRYLYIMEILENSDGEITPELETLLAQTEADKKSLIEQLCMQRAEAKGHVLTIKDEITRLQSRITDNEKLEKRIEKTIIDILKFFDMRNPSKKATNYIFKTALFTGFTRIAKTITFDDQRIGEFGLDGKVSKFITFDVKKTFAKNVVLQMLKANIATKEDVVPIIDKNAAKAYVKSLDEAPTLPLEGEVPTTPDPIINIINRDSKESITIK